MIYQITVADELKSSMLEIEMTDKFRKSEKSIRTYAGLGGFVGLLVIFLLFLPFLSLFGIEPETSIIEQEYGILSLIIYFFLVPIFASLGFRGFFLYRAFQLVRKGDIRKEDIARIKFQDPDDQNLYG